MERLNWACNLGYSRSGTLLKTGISEDLLCWSGSPPNHLSSRGNIPPTFLPARSEGHPWESWLAQRLSHFWKWEVLQWDGQVSHSEGHQLAIPVHICTVVPANLLVPHLYFFNVSPNIFSPHTSYVNVSGQPQFNRHEKKGSKMK